MDWECSASRLALARARFAAYGLDPSAFPVRVVHRSVGARRRRSAKKKEGEANTSRLTTNVPYKETAGQVRSVVPRAMGIVSLALVAGFAGLAWCGPREGVADGDGVARRGSMRRHACRDETREDTPMRR